MAERHGQAITFSGWEGGEYGLLDPGVAGRMEKQMFTGTNVLRYKSGLLGPRAGVKEVATSGAPTGTIYAFDSYLGGVWAWVNGATYQVNPFAGGTPAWSAAYTETNDPGVPTHPIASRSGSYGTGNIINIEGTSTTPSIYNFNHSGTTITRITTGPGGGQAVGGYMTRIVANDSNELWFSDPAPAFTTWANTSYVAIGPAVNHTFYNAFRDGLLIANTGGEFWLVTGVLGATTFVRRLSGGGAPFTPTRGIAVPGEMVWYFANRTDAPASFNGAIREEYEYLAGWSGGTSFTDSGTDPAFQMSLMEWAGQNDWFALTRFSDKALMYTDGSFSKHEFGVSLDPFVAGFGDQVVLAFGHASAPKYYFWQPAYYDRPGFTGDTYAQPGDASTTPLSASFSTPIWWDEEGHEVKVAQVIVDYTTWNTGSATNNFFDITVTATNRWGGASTSSSSTKTALDAAGSGFSTSGTNGRAVVTFGDQGHGNGFYVTIGNLKGTAIRNITAVLAGDPRRP